MGLTKHRGEGLDVPVGFDKAQRVRQARIHMVLDCLDAGDAEAALRVWRADDSEIVIWEFEV